MSVVADACLRMERCNRISPRRRDGLVENGAAWKPRHISEMIPALGLVQTNMAVLKSGAHRAGFVWDREGNPIDYTTATVQQLIESNTCFAGTPDQVYPQIKDLDDRVRASAICCSVAKAAFGIMKIRSRTSPSSRR